MECGILRLGIRNSALGIQNPTDDWNIKFEFYDNESGIQYLPGVRNSQRADDSCYTVWLALLVKYIAVSFSLLIGLVCVSFSRLVEDRQRFPANQDTKRNEHM